MLCYFKYGGFLLENFVTLVNSVGLNFHPAEPSIILPAGISFYTFTTLCYTIDMYKKKSEPVKSLLDFSLFVTFFPHLVAGPIVRPPQLVPQFETPRTATKIQMTDGLLLLSIGLFMKVVLADSMLAGSADAVFGAKVALSSLDAWMGVLAFSGQIFFDFAGYSTCAVGVALCLGFVLPQNFLYPYAALVNVRSKTGTAVHWACQCGNADIQKPGYTLVDGRAGKRRTDGIHKLFDAKHHLYTLFLRIWFRELQQAKILRTLFRSRRGMDFPTHILRNLVTVFPFRSL